LGFILIWLPDHHHLGPLVTLFNATATASSVKQNDRASRKAFMASIIPTNHKKDSHIAYSLPKYHASLRTLLRHSVSMKMMLQGLNCECIQYFGRFRYANDTDINIGPMLKMMPYYISSSTRNCSRDLSTQNWTLLQHSVGKPWLGGC
jgi:hypothetical protein